MLTPRRAFLIGMTALAAAPEAFASPGDNARAFYRAGAYLNAANAAAAAGAPDDLTLAARALLALVIVEPRRGDALRLIARAERFAQRALNRDSASVEARLQLAAALGMRGRRVAPAEALEAGYVPRARALIDQALARAPREPWAHAINASWHLEIVRRGGAVGARVFHASAETGWSEFARARQFAPNDPVIAAQNGLYRVWLDEDLSQARRCFAAAARLQPRDAFETFIKQQAAAVNAARTLGAAREEADRRFP